MIMNASNKPFIIAIASLSIVAVCSIGVAVGFGLGLFDEPSAAVKPQAAQSQSAESPSADSSKSATSTSSEKSAAASSSVAGSWTDASSTSSPKSSSYVQPKSSTPIIDLSKPDDYYEMNIFLSNFAEWREFYQNGREFDREEYDVKQLVNWGMWHNAINDDKALVTKSVEVAGAPASALSREITGVPATSYPRHMKTELIEKAISQYFGIDLDLKNYNSEDGAYFEHDGEMYEGLYRGDAAPRDNVALADSAKSFNGNIVCVEFTMYCGNKSIQAVSDKSWYGLTGPKLETAMRNAGSTSITTQTGTAYVEVIGSGSDRTFNLVSFAVSDKQKKSY